LPIPNQDGAPVPRSAPLDAFHEVRSSPRNFGPARLAGGTFVTPLARRLAVEAGIDLSRIVGSGPHGRIVGRDIDDARARLARGEPSFEEPIPPIYRERPHKIVPIDGMRRTIAARLTYSKATVPHFHLAARIETGRLARLRAELNESAPQDASGGPAYKLTLTDFMIKAWALALQDVPAANAIWSSAGILQFEHSDIAVAISVPGGLLTPVVAAAETKSVSALSAEARALAQRARDGALRPAEYQGGSTTISNLGMHGVEEFSAIINPPQATILAIGAAIRRPVETPDGGVAFADSMKATLSCDHRVIDGATGAKLLGCFRSLIERPLRMLV
jgi:pyruvate dehydrogenase E2 component (dihydrolipoamide acetyltransferase)